MEYKHNYNTEKSRQCYFCVNNVSHIDYKDAESLKKFVNPHSAMLRKGKTGICALHQRKMAEAIKRARFLGLLPFVSR